MTIKTKSTMTMLLFACCCLISGCSNGNVPLSGTVTFSDDGSPLAVGTVSFEGSSIRAYGTLDNKGRYVVGTEKERDGIPPGAYKIALIGAGTTGDAMQVREFGKMIDGMATFVPLVDTKFTSAESSGLSITVDKTTKTFDFQVDRPKPK